MTFVTFALVGLSVSCNAVAQLCLKASVTRARALTVEGLAVRLAPDPQFWLGCLLFGGSFGIWLLVLARLPVSVAYPLASTGYVVAAALGFLLLGESFGAARVLGIALICAGVFVLARTA